MKKFTVYYDQRNRTNYQVLAKDEEEAVKKADKLYIKGNNYPEVTTEEGWLVEADGEDK